MGLRARPSKKIDLSKIDDIQDEFFGGQAKEKTEDAGTGDSTNNKREQTTSMKTKILGDAEITIQKAEKAENPSEEETRNFNSGLSEVREAEPKNLKIADLLATAKIEGVRHMSRPFTVPRSLTIDLNRLKSRFRTRDLQYTQNELMDKMIKESLEIVTADNYLRLREEAFKFVKSPDQCSRRSVTLTESTVAEMAELKANLALALNRRFSSDEIFTTLLAIAFSSLYENGLI